MGSVKSLANETASRVRPRALAGEAVEEVDDVERAAHGVVVPALRDGPVVFEGAVERGHAVLLQGLGDLDELVVGGGHLEPELVEDLRVVDDGCRHHRVRQGAGTTRARAVLVHERLQVFAHARGGRGAAEIAERAALDEAGDLVVVVGEHDVGRVAADEARRHDVDTRAVHLDAHLVLRGVVLRDDVVHERQRLALAEGEADGLAPVGRAAREQTRPEHPHRGRREPSSPGSGLRRHLVSSSAALRICCISD